MLRHQPLKRAPMQQSGSGLLRALANESMVPWDLLVRESIQNSLDAALPGAESVRVDFDIHKFAAADLASVFPKRGLGAQLLARRPRKGRCLVVRDRHTSGLDGQVTGRSAARGGKASNFRKLVYEISRTHTDTTAGGSWGLGKTVFFRVGIGLVFYYSRIRKGRGAFEERLIACLVEDESGKNRLMPGSSTGIAWWGAPGDGPVVDGSRVRKVLSALGVEPFGEEETGTCVVVPYLRSDLRPNVGPSGTAPPHWLGCDESYLRVSIQRWYCVRLDHPQFRDWSGRPWLDARVDGRRLRQKTLDPVFGHAQRLFRVAALGESPGVPGGAPDVCRTEIKLNNAVSGSVVGWLALVELTEGDLGMAPPDNRPTPSWSLTNEPGEAGTESDEGFRPTIGFLRSPGMVVRWERSADRRGWTGGRPPDPARLTLGLFVARGEAPLHSAFIEDLRPREFATLEAFLRSTELADHHDWKDPAGIDRVRRIRGRVGDEVRSLGAPVEDDDEAVGGAVRPARILADALLPREDFGSDGRTGSGAGERGTGQDGTGKPSVRTPRPPRPRPRRSRGADGDRGGLVVTGTEYGPRGIWLDWEFAGRGGPAAIGPPVRLELGFFLQDEFRRHPGWMTIEEVVARSAEDPGAEAPPANAIEAVISDSGVEVELRLPKPCAWPLRGRTLVRVDRNEELPLLPVLRVVADAPPEGAS